MTIADRVREWREARKRSKEEKRHRKEALRAFSKVPLLPPTNPATTTLEESRQLSYELNIKELEYALRSGDKREALSTITDIGELASKDETVALRWREYATIEHEELIRKKILSYSLPRFIKKTFKGVSEFFSTSHELSFKKVFNWLFSLTSIPSWIEARRTTEEAYKIPSEENIHKAGIQNMVAVFDTLTFALLTYFAYDFVRDLNHEVFALKAAGLLSMRMVAHKAALALFAKSFAVLSVDAFKTSEQRRVENQLAGLKSIELALAALGAKDEYTRGHNERVAEYSEWIARDLGLTEREVQIVKHAAKLHDIGKLGMPDSILLKPGKPTDEEFEEIKKHPLRGYTLVAEITDIDPLLLGILHHHEKLNGKGYYGLRGDEIHLTARIISVSDIFDALTTNRPYQKGKSPEEAFSMLRTFAENGEIDAEVVEIFAKAYEKRVK